MTVDEIAAETAAALAEPHQIAPFSERAPAPSREEALAVVARLRALRGRPVVGRKIGFTNRSLWVPYRVDGPIWGDVLDTSLFDMASGAADLPLAPYVEPRIEPEIALGLKSAPTADMDEAALIDCVDWAAPAFEIVQSIYPGWRFQLVDTLIAGGLHGALLVGPRTTMSPALGAALAEVPMRLAKNGVEVATGVGANALDGPLSALRHLVSVLDADPSNPGLAAGEIVTTGTLTDAGPVAVGETWTATFSGASPGTLTLRFV